MNRILSIAILLLNLFVANNVQAQSYSSELGVGDLIKKAWDNAQNSNADIYMPRCMTIGGTSSMTIAR